MSRIDSQLDEWLSLGFINPEQHKQILQHERNKPQRSWVLFGVSGIGVIALITGVISIVAANWDDISVATRLNGYLLIQGLLGLWLFSQRNRPGILREILLTLFALFFLPGIGLIGQTFHLESDGYSAGFFWLALTLPVVLFAQSKLVSHCWFLGLAITMIAWMLAAEKFRGAGANLEVQSYYTRMMIGYGVGFLCVAVGFVRREFLNSSFRTNALSWGLMGVVGFGGSFSPTINPLLWEEGGYLSLSIWPFLSTLVAIASLFLFAKPADRQSWKLSMAGLLLLTWFSISVPLPMGKGLEQISSMFMFLLVWTLAAAASAFANRQRLFNFCTFVIAARFVVAYFEVFGTLAATGIGLIISGCVILGAVWAWAKLRVPLLRMVGGVQ